MTSHDVDFDASTIPGLAAIAAAGSLDLTGDAPGARDDARAAARAALLAHIEDEGSVPSPASPPGSRRRGSTSHRMLAVAAAALVVTAGIVVWPSAKPTSTGGGAALAADGSLSCPGTGYAHAIKPSEADLRLLPAVLPTGWTIDTISARWQVNDGSAACTRPSLTVARLGGDGVVGAVAHVFGPFTGIDTDGFLGERTRAVVDGNDALALRFAEGQGNRWVWTEDGKSWLMESLGFTAAEAAELPAAVETAGTRVSWKATADSLGLTVTHQRAGEPYSYRDERLAWNVTLRNADGEGILITADVRPRNTPEPGEILRLGRRVGEIGVPTEEWSTEGRFHYWTTLSEGVAVTAQNYASLPNGDMSKAAPEGIVRAIVASLKPVPADDPRLTAHALDEETEPHP